MSERIDGTLTATIGYVDMLKGKDGVSPIVKTSKSDGVTTLTITDAEGQKVVEIKDGADAGEDYSTLYSKIEKSVIKADVEAVTGWDDISFSVGKYIDSKGAEVANGSFQSSDYIEVAEGDVIKYNLYGYKTSVYVTTMYDSGKNRIEGYVGKTGYTAGEISVAKGVSYVRFSSSKSNLGSLTITRKQQVDSKEYIDSLKSALEEEMQDLTFTENNVTLHGWYDAVINANGYLDSSGNVTANPSHQYSDYIEVNEGDIIEYKYFSTSSYVNGVVLYDSAKNLVERKGVPASNTAYIEGTYAVPANVKYARFCSSTSKPGHFNIFMSSRSKKQSDAIVALSNHIDHEHPLKGKVWNCLGDSITYGANTAKTYWQYIAERTGINAYNYGVSNTCIAKIGDLENGMWKRYASMSDDADYITVLGGTNDHGNSVKIGEWGDSEETTLYGAMTILCEGLIAKYVGKKIGFILPLPKRNVTAAGVESIYKYGSSMDAYVDCIEDVCKRYSIPILNLYIGSNLAPWVADFRSAYIPDGLHPNAAGHELISFKIQRFLEGL